MFEWKKNGAKSLLEREALPHFAAVQMKVYDEISSSIQKQMNNSMLHILSSFQPLPEMEYSSMIHVRQLVLNINEERSKLR
ncbi:hypothetical protein TNCV_2704591 [Trichonephila clavipes]|nr:hypothetical protein TNCV_2704591 [Trichonephila clavipes]